MSYGPARTEASWGGYLMGAAKHLSVQVDTTMRVGRETTDVAPGCPLGSLQGKVNSFHTGQQIVGRSMYLHPHERDDVLDRVNLYG